MARYEDTREPPILMADNRPFEHQVAIRQPIKRIIRTEGDE